MTRISEEVANAGLDAGLDLIDVGTGDNGTLELRTGSAPTNISDAATGTLLVTIDLADPAFGSANSGSASANGTPLEGTAVDDGTIGYGRVLDADGNARLDESDVGTSGNNITVNTTDVVSGATVTVNSFTVSQPFN